MLEPQFNSPTSGIGVDAPKEIETPAGWLRASHNETRDMRWKLASPYSTHRRRARTPAPISNVMDGILKRRHHDLAASNLPRLCLAGPRTQTTIPVRVNMRLQAPSLALPSFSENKTKRSDASYGQNQHLASESLRLHRGPP